MKQHQKRVAEGKVPALLNDLDALFLADESCTDVLQVEEFKRARGDERRGSDSARHRVRRRS
jgi:hypothetical protein